MDTAQFLSTIWPGEGVFFIVTPYIDFTGEQKGYSHFGHTSIETAAWHIKKLVAEGRTIYHACASYKSKEGIKDEKSGKMRKRVATNAHSAKAFWIDLDCGAEKAADGKGYVSQAAAIEAVSDFCERTGISLPLFVSSGYGVHAYWPLQRALTPDQWTAIALRFRAVLDFYGVKHDPSRTTDIASILRPIGSLNRKRDAEIPVSAISDDVVEVDPLEFVKRLQGLISQHNMPVIAQRKAYESRPANSINSDLIDEPEYPVSDLQVVADKCQQIALVRDTKGMVEEPIWYATLGVIKYGDNAEHYAVEWSSGHPGFNEDDTLNKLDQWHYPPTTCAKFAELNCNGCEGCKFAGKNHITSPVQLGWPEPEAITQEVASVNEETGEVVMVQIPDLPGRVGEKYRWTEGGLLAKVWNEEVKEFVWEHVADAFFFPETWNKTGVSGSADGIGDADETNVMQIRMRRRPGVWETFFTPTGLLGSRAKLAEHLASKGLWGEVKLMHGYLNDWMRHMSNEIDHTYKYDRFGWHGKDFLCGDRLYRPDGSVENVRVSGEALTKAHAFTPSGTLEDWVQIIDEAYNYPGQQQFQFMVCAGFGAPLFSILGGANCPASMVSLVTYGTGEGKSTTQRSALSIYGEPTQLELSAKNTTEVAMYIYLGLYSNLPVMIDEITNIEGSKISDIAYAISQGRPKERGTQSGGLRHNNHRWATLVLTSGNRSLVGTLGATKVNAEAEIARVFEYQLADTSKHNKQEFDALMRRFVGNYGTAGEVFLKYVVTHRKEVEDMLFKVQAHIDEKVKADRKERFWSVSAASTITGAILAKKLGLINFDVAALIDWTCDRIKHLRKGMIENTSSEAEIFAELMSDVQSTLIVTDREGGGARGVRVDREPRGPKVNGRVVLDEGVMYLSITAVREWCSKKQADHNALYRWLRTNKYLAGNERSFPLGRGTSHSVPPTKCWVISTQAMDSVEANEGVKLKLAYGGVDQ